MSAPINATEVAERAYVRMRAVYPDEYQSPWSELPIAVRVAFIFMVTQGAAAALEARLHGNAGQREGAWLQ